MGESRAHRADDGSSCISAQRSLKDPSKLRISVRNMSSSLSSTEEGDRIKLDPNMEKSGQLVDYRLTDLSFLMTVVRVNRLRLMWQPSFSLAPSMFVWDALSLPARSTKFFTEKITKIRC